ncbi:MAG: S8 family peptidase [Flammeovirgaceae bacterium]
MMKRILPAIILAFIAFSCTVDEGREIVPKEAVKSVSVEEINQVIQSSLEETNEFKWSSVGPEYVSSAAGSTDKTITIGYQPEGFQNINERIHEINVNDPEWVEARREILSAIQEVYNNLDMDVNVEERILRVHEVLPYINIEAHEYEVIAKLRTMNTVRYAEPRTYEFEFDYQQPNNQRTLSGSGCADGGSGESINSADFTNISGGNKASWTLYQHNIPAAWSYSKGNNVGVGVIDTGLSPSQNKLNSQFSAGQSSGRSRFKYGTYVSSWWPWANPDGPDDQCGHGTSMAGAAVAPRAGDGMSVGVAYQADLYSVRAIGDVIISSGRDKDGVSDAYVLLGNKSGVKVISMSLGTPLWSNQVADAVRYAYGRGKLIFCAAGTSTSFTNWYGVIFPATMSETVAVTGIKDNGYNRCDVCHDGSAVDFVVTMQRANNGGRTALTLPFFGTGGTEYVGGSSVATATTAGMAALVWARNTSWSRTTVLNKLKQAAEFYPNRSSKHGWGKIDALQAVQ